MRKLKGSLVAVATPFTSTFEIDEKAFSELVEWQVASGTDGIVVCGTTGEAPTISSEEQYRLVKRAVEIAKGRVAILAGTGTNDTRTSVLRTQQAQKAGADGCLLIFPYYNRPTFQGCLAHFREIAKIGLPMMLYYHPARTTLKLSAQQLAELCSIEGVFAIKESPGDMELAVELMQKTSVSFFSGDDGVALPFLAVGAAGVCSVLANIIPREWKRLNDAVHEGNLREAREIYFHYLPLCKAIFLEPNPMGIKYALSLMEKCSPFLRLPLVEPEESTKKRIREEMEKVGLIGNKASLLTKIKSSLASK
ncbi:MAG: 4-hydroxy-tetrahydrodipicolinate synthase [Chlamydiales bacterium]